eukprot:COSAG05_NODE_6345_length_976_cov_27.250855_1_plen_57_part_00
MGPGVVADRSAIQHGAAAGPVDGGAEETTEEGDREAVADQALEVPHEGRNRRLCNL